MIRRDYHIHTDRCDGIAPAEETIKAAIEMGLEEIGFSEHSHTSFDENYCLSHEETEEYRKDIIALRDRYAEQISIKAGLEMDIWSDSTKEGFDYWIGSVHYLKVPDRGEAPEDVCVYEGMAYIPIDLSAELLRQAVDFYFDGDPIAFAERYFTTVGEVAERTGCHIIGHFDLITKFEEQHPLFDQEDPRYIAAWKNAVDRLIPYEVPFEINTGAISRGYRTTPYPAEPIREYIREKGGKFILSSDSHRSDTLCYAFDEYESELL